MLFLIGTGRHDLSRPCMGLNASRRAGFGQFKPAHAPVLTGECASAHSTSTEGSRRAIMAGVETIEHGDGLTPELFRLMKERGTALCPTGMEAGVRRRLADQLAQVIGGREPIVVPLAPCGLLPMPGQGTVLVLSGPATCFIIGSERCLPTA